MWCSSCHEVPERGAVDFQCPLVLWSVAEGIVSTFHHCCSNSIKLNLPMRPLCSKWVIGDIYNLTSPLHFVIEHAGLTYSRQIAPQQRKKWENIMPQVLSHTSGWSWDQSAWYSWYYRNFPLFLWSLPWRLGKHVTSAVMQELDYSICNALHCSGSLPPKAHGISSCRAGKQH